MSCIHPAGLAATITRNEVGTLRYQTPRHLQYISHRIARTIAGYAPKPYLMIFAPPRHGKSELTSKWTPVWTLNNWPHKRVMFGTYSGDFAFDWGRKVRNAIETYADDLAVRLSDDSLSANRWNTTAGGGMIAQGVGGSFTGRGADVAICDDPFKNDEDANSAKIRDKVWGWWGSTFMTRLEPGATCILTLTRWHTDDLAGRILADKDMAPLWDVISLPAVVDDQSGPCPLGRSKGEVLWPERVAAPEMERKRISVGSYVWDALYQQRPPNLNGGSVYGNFAYVEWPTGNICNDLKVEPGVPLMLNIDFNVQPGSHAEISQFLPAYGRMHVLDELFTPNGVAQQIAEAFVEWWDKHRPDVPIVHLCGDPAGGARVMTDGGNAWDKVKAVLKQAGIPFKVKVRTSAPGVLNRVTAMNDALLNAAGQRAMLIHPQCSKLLTDLQKVTWDGSEINKTNKFLSHASDALGYGVHWFMPINDS